MGIYTMQYHKINSNQSLVIVGGGGHGRVVLDAAVLQGWTIKGFLDSNPNALLSTLDIPYLGTFDQINSITAHDDGSNTSCFVAIGKNTTRQNLLNEIRDAPCIIHPSAIIANDVVLDSGILIAAGVIINSGSTIGNGAILNTGCIVEHDCMIGECTHIAPGVILGGNVSVDANVLIGLGSRVIPGCHIGANTTIGAGSVVIQNVPVGATVMGVPAK